MTNPAIEIITSSPGRTIELGRQIGAALKGYEIIALTGPLGSGKTHLVKGIAGGCGCDERFCVSSPTFVIINEYSSTSSPVEIYHIDAYRLSGPAELEALGLDDMHRRDSVVIIEWADKVGGVPEGLDTIRISLSHVSENKRRIVLENLPSYIKLTGDGMTTCGDGMTT